MLRAKDVLERREIIMNVRGGKYQVIDTCYDAIDEEGLVKKPS